MCNARTKIPGDKTLWDVRGGGSVAIRSDLRSLRHSRDAYAAASMYYLQDMKMEAAKISLATATQSVASAWAMVSASADVGSRMSYQYQM